MRIYTSIFCLAAIARLAAQDTVIRTESRVVLVDAVVTDKKGHYVRDLKQKDFRVWEDNREQTITSFTFDAGAASPENDRKHYLVLFFDDSTSSPQDQIVARAAAVKFIDANTGKNRLMAVVEYASTLRVTQNFTDDPDRLKKVVNGVKFSSLSPNGGPAAVRSYAVRGVLQALREFARSMANVPGRKTLVFISAGFRLEQDNYPELNATINACNRADVAIYPIDIHGLISQNGASLRSPQTGILQPAAFQGRGAGTRSSSRTPPGMDQPIGGGRGGGASQVMDSQMVLSSLAHGTGGFMINNSNDVLAGLEKIGKEQNEVYLLGYTPTKEIEPGTCHAIKVKVEGGLQVRFRSGYCDVKPKDVLAGTPTERDLENRVKGDAASTVKAAMQAPFVYISSGTARVDMVLDIPAEALVLGKEKGKFHMALNVIGVVHLPDGGVAARFSDTVKRDFEDKKQVDAFHSRPFQYEKQFEVASGKYTLDVAFSSGETFGKLSAPLNVDAYDNKQFHMSALVLSRDAHPATGSSMILDDLVPFVVNGVEITPTGANHFSKAEHGFVYAEIYEPESVPVGAVMQIADLKAGKVVFDSGLVRLDAKPDPGNPMIPFALKLDFTNLQPGAYRIFLSTGDSAGRKFDRTADFEIR
jgi:VWFA-related protein